MSNPSRVGSPCRDIDPVEALVKGEAVSGEIDGSLQAHRGHSSRLAGKYVSNARSGQGPQDRCPRPHTFVPSGLRKTSTTKQARTCGLWAHRCDDRARIVPHWRVATTSLGYAYHLCEEDGRSVVLRSWKPRRSCAGLDARDGPQANRRFRPSPLDRAPRT